MQLNGMNARSGKDHNRALMLKMIRKHPGISRKEICERSGLTKGAVTKIVNGLMENGLVAESLSSEDDGRIRNLRIADLDKVILSFYLGRMKLSGAVVAIDGTILFREELYEGVTPYGNEELLGHLQALIDSLLGSGLSPYEKILGIGIAVPGDRREDRDGSPVPIAYDWEGLGLEEFIKSRFDQPLFIENNSNMAALGEAWFGRAVESSQFIEYTIGAGIGAGVIHDETLYGDEEYRHICAIGHTSVDYRGERCFCGNRGCLETVGNLEKLVREYRRRSGRSLFDSEDDNGPRFIAELKYILKKGREGDPTALAVIEDHASIIATGAVTLFNLFNPEQIVVVEDDLDDVNLDILVNFIEKHARERVYPTLARRLDICHSGLGEDIFLLGAFARVLEKAFEDFERLEALVAGAPVKSGR